MQMKNIKSLMKILNRQLIKLFRENYYKFKINIRINLINIKINRIIINSQYNNKNIKIKYFLKLKFVLIYKLEIAKLGPLADSRIVKKNSDKNLI